VGLINCLVKYIICYVKQLSKENIGLELKRSELIMSIRLQRLLSKFLMEKRFQLENLDTSTEGRDMVITMEHTEEERAHTMMVISNVGNVGKLTRNFLMNWQNI
jgi:hypothetical protein